MSTNKRTKKFSPHLLILVVLAAIFIVIFKNGILTEARNVKSTPSPTSQVAVVSPNGGEKFYQGQANTISWKGGYRTVAIGLATADANTNHAIALPDGNTTYSGRGTGSTGSVIGFINTREVPGYYFPNSSTTWDGLKVCNFHLNLDADTWCKDVQPGNYKIFVWSEGENGQSMCIGSGEGPTGKYTTKNSYGCNWDLSDQPFTILAP